MFERSKLIVIAMMMLTSVTFAVTPQPGEWTATGTGTFVGAPPDEQVKLSFRFTVSDDQLSLTTEGDIRILASS